MDIQLKDRTRDTVTTYHEKVKNPNIGAMLPQKERTLEEALADYEKSQLPGADSYGETIWVDGLYVGDIWCYQIHTDQTPNAMISYCIFEENFWSRGIATRAVSVFLHKILSRYHLVSVGAFVLASNPASIQVLVKNQFSIRERFREDRVESVYLQYEKEVSPVSSTTEPLSISAHGVTVTLCPETLCYEIQAGGRTWQQDPGCAPCIVLADPDPSKASCSFDAAGYNAARFRSSEGKLPFFLASSISHRYYHSGVGTGILSSYSGFPSLDGYVSMDGFAFETLVWIETATGYVRFELIPVTEGGPFTAILWPVPFLFEEPDPLAYTVMPVLQGLLIPNTWETEVEDLPFNGQMCSAGAYMPWFGQADHRQGYIAICEQPWDAGYRICHPAGGPYSHVGMYFLPSLGKLAYRRITRFVFLEDCDYNDLCKVYRAYARETGLFTTLIEKAARNPLVAKLVGAAIVHKGIKTHICPDSRFYDRKHPEKNDLVVPFAQRTQEILHYRKKGISKLYLHLDGWGDPGYDNRHPDYLPACEEAGGWEAMKELSDAIAECGYILGLHDQYRDYYMDAPSFDREFACTAPDGSILDVARWAGGRQSYLCATQAPYYVKRNFQEILRHGIHLEASYLDVFTCNEGDECANPHHRMTRKECFEYRNACFAYLSSQDILPSSEECGDWAMRQLVFCHYGPYDFMLAKPGSPRRGIPVPLFNLVYHDCILLPWPMDRLPNTEDYMLYALLNGGGAYLDKDGAYPDCDGAFDEARKRQLEESISRYRIVASLQEQVAPYEMLRHEFLEGNRNRQRTHFADGTVVTVDLENGTYEIRNR